MQAAGASDVSRGIAAMGCGSRPDLISDNLRGKYTSAADDGSSSGKKREAAMLFSVAEGHLGDDAPAEALISAKDAVTIFREIGDAMGLADSLRLTMHATRMKAVAERAKGNAVDAIRMLEEAEIQMRDELKSFEDSGDKRGQACMLLAMAEAGHALGGSPKRAEALDCLLDAGDMAHEAGDRKLEALVALEKASVQHSRHNFKGALQAAKEAANLFKAAEDSKNEALAWYSLGAADINCGRLEEGLRGKTKALKLFREVGDKRMQGLALNSFAEWYLLEKDDFQASLSAAKEAAGLFKDIGDTSGASIAKCWIIESHLRNKDTTAALEEAKANLEAAKEKDDQKATFWALECLMRVHLTNSDQDTALDTAQELLNLAGEIDDKRYNCRGLEAMSTVHSAMYNLDMAVEKASDSVELAKDLKGYEDEAFNSAQFLAQVCMQKNDFKAAAEGLEQARAIAQKADDTYLEGVAMLGLSGAHAMNNDVNKAVKAATLAKEMFHEEGFVRGEARALKGMAEFSAQKGDYAGAVRTCLEGSDLIEDFGDNRFAALMKHTLATIHLFNDQPAEAARAAMDALKYARLEEDRRVTIQMLFLALDANNVILQDAASDEKQTKTFKQGCEKMLRFAKEAVGLAVKVKDAGLEAAANYWVGHLSLMSGQVRESQQAASKTLTLSREIKDTPLEVRTLVLTAHAHLALAEQAQAVKVLNDATAVAGEAGDSDGSSMAATLLETIVGRQQAAPQWSPEMMAQWDAQAGAASAAGAVEAYKPPDNMMVRQYITGLVQNMTGSSDEIDGDTPLMESGIDSLASVELRTQLQQEFKLNLPSTVMFNYPTITTMTRLLVDECTTKKIAWG